MFADVADEADAAAVRRDVEPLGDVRAVEAHRVGAVLALDDVAAVARVPDERVVARAQERGVVALVAVHDVVAVARDHGLGPAAPATVSLPAPLSITSEISPAGRPAAAIASSPSSPLTMRLSVGSALRILTVGGGR